MEGIGELGLGGDGLAGQRRVGVGGIEQHGCHDHRRLANVLGTKMIERIGVRMVYVAGVVQWILHKLERGQPDLTHQLVIG